MKIIKDLFKHSTKIFNTLKPGDKQQLEEIQRLEEQIKQFQQSDKKEKKEFSISNRLLFKFWFFAMLVVFLGYIAFQSLDILYLILASYIVSIAVEAVIDMFERWKCSRGIAITITYFLLAVFLLSGFVLIAPFLINQITEIINIFLVKLNTLQTLIQTKGLVEVLKSSGFLSEYVKQEVFHNFSDPAMVTDLQIKLQSSMAQLSSMWSNYAQSLGNFAVNFVTGFVTFLIKGGLVITLAVLFSIEKVSVMKFIASLGGQKKYKYIYIKLEKIYKKLGIWLKSRLLLSLYVAITLYVALWILTFFGIDIGNKASLAIILGLLDIVPYIGPFVGGLPAVLAGLTDYGIWVGVIMTGIVFLINTLESNVMTPMLMNKSLGINTVVIFISMILGGMIMGFTGILLAVPIAAIITLIFEKDYEE